MARYIDLDKLLKGLEDELKDKNPNDIAYLVFKLFIGRLNHEPTAEVVPKSEEGAECPTCHGTGRIGTTDWLTKNISKKQLAEEKAKAIAEHEQHVKTEVAREIFEEIEKNLFDTRIDFYEKFKFKASLGYDKEQFEYAKAMIMNVNILKKDLAELKKKYTEGENV